MNLRLGEQLAAGWLAGSWLAGWQVAGWLADGWLAGWLGSGRNLIEKLTNYQGN